MVLASLLAFLLAAVLPAEDPTPRNPLALGAAPAFTLPSVRDNRLITKDDFAGKVVLIEIWRTNCPRCQREADYIAQLRQKYAARGFEILCVGDEDFDPKKDPITRLLQYASEHKFEHPIAINDGGEFHTGYYQRMKGTPSAYLMRRNGELTFLGEDPARPEMRGDLEKLVEKYLDEAAPTAIPPRAVSVKTLPEFTLLSYRGGVIKSQDLRGQPVLLAFITPRLAPRYGPALSALSTKYGALGLRVIGVMFGAHRDIASSVEQLQPGYEVALPDAPALESLVGSDYLPKFIFATAEGKILKTINTIYGREAGVEGTVFDRYAGMLVGKDTKLPELVDASAQLAKLGYRHPELGFGFDPPKGYKTAPNQDGSKIRYVGSGSQDLRVIFEQRYGSDTAAAERVADVVGEGIAGRRIESRAWQDLNGAKTFIVKESWSSPLGGIRATRILVPVSGGIYVVTVSAPEVEYIKESEMLEASLFSFQAGTGTR